jgi:hypothetical protein
MQIDLVRSGEVALITSKALLQVACESALACARLATIRARYWQVTVLLMAKELRLGREDEFAAITPKVILLVMCLQSLIVWTIEVAAWL